MKEADITAKLIKHLRAQPRTWAYKVHASQFGNGGQPDIDGCMDGRALKIEVKQPGGGRKPTPLQKNALRQWERVGALAGWVTSLEELIELLAHVREQTWLNPQLVRQPDESPD